MDRHDIQGGFCVFVWRGSSQWRFWRAQQCFCRYRFWLEFLNLRMGDYILHPGLVDPGCRSSSDGGGAGAHDPGGSGACSQGDHPEQGEVPGLPGSEFGMAIWVC